MQEVELNAVNVPTNKDLIDGFDTEIKDDGRIWISREKMLETALYELTAERDFLRQILVTLINNSETDA